MTTRRGRVLVVVTSAVLLLIVAVVALRSAAAPVPIATRSTSTPTVSATSGDGPPVIVPGRPGESAVVRPAQEVRDAGPPRYNTMDAWFVRMMIPHHIQALQMAALAPDRAGDPRVRAFAERIRTSQAPEIGMMRGWLDTRGLALEVTGHDHGTMRGMQSPEAMRRLAAARGVDFDRLFVRMMTDHHQGAVEMATNLLKVGADLAIEELATSVAAEQAVEMDRMRELIDS